MDKQTRQIEKLAQDWAAAGMRGDTAFLERALVGDFVGVGPRGFVPNKEGWMERHEAGKLKYESFGLDEVGVRDRRGGVRGRERQLRHPRAVSRDADLREAGGTVVAGWSAPEPYRRETSNT